MYFKVFVMCALVVMVGCGEHKYSEPLNISELRRGDKILLECRVKFYRKGDIYVTGRDGEILTVIDQYELDQMNAKIINE